MTKSTYWLTGPDGHLVQVEGAARRVELADHGWTEVDGPGLNDRVWMQHEGIGAFALFPAAAPEPHLARGWQYAVPPTERGDLGHHVALPEPTTAAQPAAETPAAATPPVETKPSMSAAGGDRKEKP